MSARPLAGIRVLEFAHVMAGPVCGRMLADWGADVVKIEPPGAGDPARALTPGRRDDPGGLVHRRPGARADAGRGTTPAPVAPGRGARPHAPPPSTTRPPGMSDPLAQPAPAERGGPAFAMLNRNKRGAVLDLKTPAGVAAARHMLVRCDVAIENFRPGTMERLGLGYESLRAENPRLVYCQITGFGRTGPLAHHPGFDLIAQGRTGLMSITGEGPGRPPVKCGPPLTDITAGLLGAMGVLAALYDRERTGQGRRVDTSLYEAGIFQTLWQSAAALATGESPGALGSAHPLAAPYEAFPTKDGWIAVGAWNQANWERLAEAMDLPELARDPRFATNADRMTNQHALREIMNARLAEATAAEWLARFESASVPAGPVATIGDMLRHPQTLARQMIVPVPDCPDSQDQVAGQDETIGTPVKLADEPLEIGRPAPELDEHTREALAEYGLRAR